MSKPNLSIVSLNLPDLNDALYAIESMTMSDWGGTIGDDVIVYAARAGNLVWASPDGVQGKPAFRALVTGDLPNLGVTTGKIAADAVTDAKLRDSAALSVIGRSANSIGDPADIAAGTDGHVLRRSGTTLGFGTVADSSLSANVALENATQTWTQKQTFSAAPELTLGFSERGRSVIAGEWSTRAYSAGNFTSNSGTWTVESLDVFADAWTRFGKTLIWSFYLANTALSVATSSDLRVTLPEGLTIANPSYQRLAFATDNAGLVGARALLNTGNSYMQLMNDASNWPIGAISVMGLVIVNTTT